MSFGSILIAERLKNYKKEDLHKSEVHMNLFKKVIQNRFRTNVVYNLDVGIKLFDYNNTVDSITLFFPFTFTKDSINDLGKDLSESKSLVNVIFNENMLYKGSIGRNSLNKYESTVGDDDEKKNRSFILYNLAENNYIFESIKIDDYSGTSLTIKLSEGAELTDSEKHGNLYFRFRILIDEKKQKWLKRDENLSNDVLQAAFSKTELYDIRINDRRETSDKVLEKMENDMKNTLLSLKRIHFFFVTSVVDEVTNGTLEQMDTRMLELDRWGNYLPYDDNHPRIAYQWKKIAEKDKAFDNFEIFFRNTCDNRNYRKILLYLFVAFWIGSVGSTIASIGMECGNVSWVVMLMTIIIVGYYCVKKP